MIDPTDKEQLKHYYEHELPEEIRGVLTQINALIGQDKNGEIFDAYMKWLVYLTDPKILQDYARQRAEAKIGDQETEDVWVTMVENYGYMSVEEFLSIAVLGLRLIYHVDYNASLGDGNPAAGHILIKNSQVLLDSLDVEHLPPVTVHGGEVYWQGEFDQASAKTHQILGEPDEAGLILESQLEKLAEKESGEPNQLTPAEQSAKAVILYRHGKLSGNLAESAQGIQTEVDNAERQFNRDRILDLALGTLKTAVNPEVKASLASRLTAIKEILLAIAYTTYHDRKGTYQYFKRQRSKAT